MSSTITPNMNLIVPGVGTEPGPTWGTDLNADLGILDQHNHSTGQGVPITPAGININADLPINGNNLTFVKTVNFQAQGSSLAGAAPNLGCVYVAGNELYYNDESGNVVAITKTGSVNAGAGSITGLPSGTASASYNAGSQTFVWQSATNTPANMDGGSFIFRDITANSHGVTLSAPPALASDLQLFWPPALPTSTSLVTLDTSGNIATFPSSPPAVNSYVEVSSSGVLSLTPIIGPNLVISSSSGNFTTTSNTAVSVTNMSVTITTLGGPVVIGFKGGGAAAAYIGLESTFNEFVSAFYKIQRDGTDISLQDHRSFNQGDSTVQVWIPPGALNIIDDGATAGSHTYTLQVAMLGSATNTVVVNEVFMYAYELK